MGVRYWTVDISYCFQIFDFLLTYLNEEDLCHQQNDALCRVQFHYKDIDVK